MNERGLELLRTALANPAADFRAGQWECVDGILRSQRQLVVQKTGRGKRMVHLVLPGLEIAPGETMAKRASYGQVVRDLRLRQALQ